MKKEKGFTLIELILGIVIAGFVLITMARVIMNATTKSIYPEYYLTASALSRMGIEQLTNQRYDSISSVNGTFTGSFSAYSYDVVVDYVDPDVLDTTSLSDTGCKRINITISRNGLPSLMVTTLATRH